MELKRVVVTGFGAITPIGNNAKEYWESLIKGESGAAPITLFDASQFKTKFACEVKNFNPLDHFDKKEAKKMDRNTQLGIVAAREAVVHSGILNGELNKNQSWGNLGLGNWRFRNFRKRSSGLGEYRHSTFQSILYSKNDCGHYRRPDFY